MNKFAVTEAARGKTKAIYRFNDVKTLCRVVSFDDMTAGDGAKHAEVTGKGKLSTRTTSNIFNFLKRRGVPVAFNKQDSPDSFIADYCKMIPLEIVGRYRVDEKSSYLKRNPHIAAGTRFEPPVVEFFLKTTGKCWKGTELPCDDPYLAGIPGEDAFAAYVPNKPVEEGRALTIVRFADLGLTRADVEILIDSAHMLNAVLKAGFDAVGADLADYKWEAGINSFGRIVVADVIDADSMRVKYEGREISKQLFRDGADLKTVESGLVTVAHLTELLPH